MIPKIIHYCWFGGSPLPKMAKKCIESWKKYCPNFIIKEWNESNFDLSVCNYVKEAYAERKWAFVSDYARFWILYHEGGVYFDTDVELIRPIDDICEKGAFMGCEWIIGRQGKKTHQANPGLGLAAAPGLGLAAAPGLGLYKDILNFYTLTGFYRKNGSVNLTTVVTNTTAILRAHGWQPKLEIQCIDSVYVYPPEYFCPINYGTGEIHITKNTRSIHHYAESWMDLNTRRKNQVRRILIRRFGEKTGYRIWCIYAFPFRLRRKLKNLGIKNMAKFILRK